MKVKRWRRNEVTPRGIACQAAEASCALHDAHGQRGAKGREAIDVWRGSLDGGARAESRVVVLLRKHHPANSRKSAVFEARGCAELRKDSDRPPALRTRVRYEKFVSEDYNNATDSRCHTTIVGYRQDTSVLDGKKCVQGVTMCGRGIGFHFRASVCARPLPRALARRAARALTRARASQPPPRHAWPPCA